MWFTLPVIYGRQLAPIRSIRIDGPDVRVLHGRFEIGETALAALVHELAAIGRPLRPILDVLRRGEPSYASVTYLQRKEVIVKELIFIGLAVRNENDLVSARRPVNRMLGVIA